jgi:hypothetical protein
VIDSSTAPPTADGTDVHVPDRVPNLDAEPLPPACMSGTCACPSAPDGADQHAAP